MTFDPPDIDTDEDAVTDRILANLGDAIAGWEPYEGSPEVALAEEIGRETAATNQLAADALDFAAAGVGQTVYQLLPFQGTPATLPDVEITFTPVAPGPAGLAESTIPAGFTIVAGGVAFELLADVTPVDTSPIHVSMQAVDPGTAGNITVGAPLDAEVITSTLAVASATVLASGTGGVDEETITDYLARLVDYVSLLRLGGVRGDDLAAVARTVPGVHRALGLDLYDPADGLYTHERTATVIAIDEAGQAVTSTALTDALAAVREVNFVINTTTPTYTQVAVVVDLYSAAGVDPTQLEADVTAAIATAIDPGTWGSSGADPQAWTEKTTLRTFDIAAAVFSVPGVAGVNTITVNGGTTVTLTGPGALPRSVDDLSTPSTVTVTATPLP